MSDWPYDDDEPPELPPAPTWSCPEGICTCAEHGEHEPYEFSVLLREPDDKPMPGARCRVWVHGRIANEDKPNADGAGRLTVELTHPVELVFIEWAPADTPLRAPYPHQQSYYVAVHDEHPREAGRRRLHNLGFSLRSSLEENVRDYQREYGHAPQTGELEDIEGELIRFHDYGVVPTGGGGPIAVDGEEPEREGDEDVLQLDGGEGIRQLDGGEDLQKLDGEGGGGGGESAEGESGDPSVAAPNPDNGTNKKHALLPKVDEVLSHPDLTALYQFVRIDVKATPCRDGKTYDAHFWVFDDAFKWVLPAPGTKAAKKYKDAIDLYDYEEDLMAPGKRTWRLPCNVVDTVYACQNGVAHHQGQLPEAEAEVDHHNRHQIWLLPTPKLYRARYDNAALKVLANLSGLMLMNEKKGLTEASNEHNKRINQAAKTKWGSTPGRPLLLADPGKTWAIHNMMDRPNYQLKGKRKVRHPGQCKQVFEPSDKAAVNYGFHRPNAGGKPWQGPGRCHGKGHSDYSQLFVAVAGWCEIREVGTSTWHFKRTAEVYTSKELSPLAVRGRLPVYKARYDDIIR